MKASVLVTACILVVFSCFNASARSSPIPGLFDVLPQSQLKDNPEKTPNPLPPSLLEQIKAILRSLAEYVLGGKAPEDVLSQLNDQVKQLSEHLFDPQLLPKIIEQLKETMEKLDIPLLKGGNLEELQSKLQEFLKGQLPDNTTNAGENKEDGSKTDGDGKKSGGDNHQDGKKPPPKPSQPH